MPKIIVIVGPTASGKTALALSVAEQIPSEIISADSRQIYKHLSIGTAKPTPTELKKVPHHFIDAFEPDQKFNAGDFQLQGRTIIGQILERKKQVIIVGGTGLYVQAIIDGLFELPDISGSVRELLEIRLNREGKEALYQELKSVDPVSAAMMDASKQRRVIRALEVYHETGVPISMFHSQHIVKALYDAHFYGLRWERNILYERINERVDTMLANGLLDEVKGLRSRGFDDRHQSLQTVGYKEANAFLSNMVSKERMVELIKQNTRRFAKRQMTWFRKDNRITWLDISSVDQIENIASFIRAAVK